MPVNANSFNSRVTSEALEKKFRDTFPAQGGAELIQDLYAQGTIVPIVDFTDSAIGSVLRADLQTAADFATGFSSSRNSTVSLVSTPGFWALDIIASGVNSTTANERVALEITNGLATKVIWQMSFVGNPTQTQMSAADDKFICFLRTGDTLQSVSDTTELIINVSYRQIADVYGNLINPLGFVSQ